MKKLFALIEITRPINVIITSIVVGISIFLFNKYSLNTTNLILAIVSAGLVVAAGNVINDFFDVEIDIINKPNRPIPSGRVSKNEAIILFCIASVSASITSFLLSYLAFIIVLVTLFFLFTYSFIFKSIPLVGNVIIAFCTGLAFIFAGIVAQNIRAAFIPAFFAFQINLIRELVKDIEDIEGDDKNSYKTYPIKFGLVKTKFLIYFLTFILILSTLFPFLFRLYRIEYFLIVLFFVNLPLIYFLKVFGRFNFSNSISTLSIVLKAVMITGLISIYAGLI